MRLVLQEEFEADLVSSRRTDSLYFNRACLSDLRLASNYYEYVIHQERSG